MSLSYDTVQKTPIVGAMTGLLNDVYAYWDELRGAHETPQWRAFNWMRLPPKVIPWCAVADVRENPLDFVYRFWGTARTELQGHDYTGWSIGDVSPASVAAKIVEEYRSIYQSRKPVYFETSYVSEGKSGVFVYHFLRLPLASAEMPVGHILSAGLYEETDIRKIHDLFGIKDD